LRVYLEIAGSTIIADVSRLTTDWLASGARVSIQVAPGAVRILK
jgi:hypothetical protein